MRKIYNIYLPENGVYRQVAKGLDHEAMTNFFVQNNHNDVHLEEILTDDTIPLVLREYHILNGKKELYLQRFIDDAFLTEFNIDLEEIY